MAVSAQRARLAGSERPRPHWHRPLGPLAHGETLGVTIVVRPAPGSPPLPTLEDWQAIPLAERRYLSPQQYAARHGASAADIAAVESFAQAHGLKVVESHSGRRSVMVEGTAGHMNAAFGITLHRFEAPLPTAPRARKHGAPPEAGAAAATLPVETHIHHGYDGAVTIPAELAGIVHAVVGLDNRRVSAPAGATGDPSGAAQVEVPTIAAWYNFPNSGAKDQTIGVFAPTPSAYLQADITNSYFPNLTDASYRTAPTLNDIGLTVGSTTYSNNTASVTAITGATTNATLNALPDSYILEVTQDISTSATIAQGCTVNVYFTEDTEQGWLVFLNRILQPESEPQPTVVTASFVLAFEDSTIGSPSDTSSVAGTLSPLFQALAGLGIDVFIALGDWGADNRQTDGAIHVGYCATDPYVTSCGGTVAVKSGSTLTEYVWSDAFSTSGFGSSTTDFGATGGGVSAAFTTAPAYQSAIGVTGATDSGGTAHTGRGVPDVAGMVGYFGFVINGANSNPLSYNFVGTSCVAPLYAGLAAVLRSAFGRAIGPFNTTLYALQDVAFNDITFGNNDSADTPDSPYFTAGTGWDACTGLGSIDGTRLLNGIASLLYSPNLYFQVNKGSYGLEEVTLNADYSDPTPLWLVLEGFTPSALGAAAITPDIVASIAGVTVTAGSPQPEIPGMPNTPQRIYFPCSVSFAASAIKTVPQGGIFPVPGNPPVSTPVLLLAQSFTVAGQLLPGAETTLALEPGADPYFANFATNGEFYLSQDLRVFTVCPGIPALQAPIDGIALNASSTTSWDSGAAYSYIEALLGHLNSTYSDPGGTDPFTLFPDQTNALSGDSSVTPTQVDPAHPTGTPFANYNFAVAKVRLSGTPSTSSDANVRVLFRLFAAQTSDTDYNLLTYPSTLDAEGQPLAPQLGVGNVTIPFFATGNYESNSDFAANTDYAGNSINNQPVAIGASGQSWAYYGCYLNLYPTANTITTGAGTRSVQSLLPSTHSCIVAQLVYDDAPYPTGSGVLLGPEYSDTFAQRNLQVTFSDNPGPASTHRVPQTFDTRPGPAPGTGQLLNYPDELMIDWGNTPVGSTASIYWPTVAAAGVLALADQLYSTHQLSAADAHTIQCTVPRGITSVPIPAGTGANYAGLFTVDLPPGVTSGEIFTITVRRISTRRSTPAPAPPAPPPIEGRPAAQPASKRAPMRNWRYVVGSFAVRIPVTTAAVMLPLEENTYSIIKWRLSQLPSADRWIPVLQRYLGLVEGRIGGLGGNPGSIEPSPWGSYGPPPQRGPGRDHDREHMATGKVNGVVYDRFGDFAGFALLTEHDRERVYRSREPSIEALVRYAWAERVVITVVCNTRHPAEPDRIVLRRAPHRPYRP